jgi:tetratricopeptide (TPR) repeat protein
MLTGKSRRARPFAAAAALAASIASTSPQVHAQSTTDELARRHFDSGVAYLEESDYDSAITAFQKSFDLSQRPEILLNLATVYERKGDLAAAVDSLHRYLEAAPRGEHVTTVQLRLQNLEKRRAAESRPAPPPGTAPATPVPTPEPAATTPAPKPDSRRLPAFVSLGVGGLLAGGALATGLVAKAKYDDAADTCGPTCSSEQLSSSRTFAITSTALTGAAALGIGLGVVLLLTTPEEERPAHATLPRWDVVVSPRAAAASAAWTF